MEELEGGTDQKGVGWGRRERGIGGAEGRSKKGRRPQKEPSPEQLHLFGERSPVLEELSKIDISSMTPLEAITKLYELQQRAKEG